MREILDYKALGIRIRQKRQELHLTQEELAKKADISLSFFGHIERGSRKASIATLISIARALHTTTDSLLYDSFPKDDYNDMIIIPHADIFILLRKAIDIFETEYKGKVL